MEIPLQYCRRSGSPAPRRPGTRPHQVQMGLSHVSRASFAFRINTIRWWQPAPYNFLNFPMFHISSKTANDGRCTARELTLARCTVGTNSFELRIRHDINMALAIWICVCNNSIYKYEMNTFIHSLRLHIFFSLISFDNSLFSVYLYECGKIGLQFAVSFRTWLCELE